MKTYIALLRGINVGGQKKIKMADLRQTLERSGLQNVKTYIQSGNIVFDSEMSKIEEIQDSIYDAILSDFGFEVPILVVTGGEIERILKENPFINKTTENNLYFVLLKEVPNQSLVDEFNAISFDHEDFYITDNCVYLCCKRGYGNAKLNNNLIERMLKVSATARNLRTMQKLLELSGN
ncbi:DUF1697 domain-containing protein [Flagellimonas hymeniacidonis]|uniref:DUF1697 domain-containing protein n=1 Tax=Flagellimonas hymeniacidonis TaxID=2603628 RepID=A0A5C8VBD8_9FLAO|nr:DUF1697 domain-containing protein [Flagellimonas hymeniacidonis]TXN38128.1 DUF1697 domain-containing protein [Flagellimonas hymeniacidonis]